MKLGIVQGRLLKPVGKKMQEFPKDWEKEFELLKKLQLHHIEWCITKKSFANVLDLNIKKYSQYISSICCDNLINKNIAYKDFLNRQLQPVCAFALRNNIKSITIPLLEHSNIDEFVDIFIENINVYGDNYPQLKFNFELESPHYVAQKLCSSRSNFFLTYDTGNITSCKFDHVEYINNCFEFINTIHLKDRTINPIESVEPTTGDTDFNLIFKTLNKLGYNDKFTIQTSRGETGHEVDTIRRHKKLFEDIWKIYLI